MKKYLLLFIITVYLLLSSPLYVFAARDSLAERMRGRILLQVESYGRAWYVHPVDGARYYLKDGQTAYDIMRTMGLGITNTDLAKIPTQRGQWYDRQLVSRLSGRIVLQVEEHGEAWYINPIDGLRYHLKDGEAAYELMRSFSHGISDDDLSLIPMNTTQIVHDTTFDDVAYVQMRQGSIIASKHASQILPPASMSKLMTALVLLDQENLNWNQRITISQSHIDYPTLFVGDDPTSEITLSVGDVMSYYDLWVAMLVASSNQAAIALVDSTGLTRSEFVAAMNAKAEELGLSRTLFFDPTGLDAHSVTTAYEMAIIAQTAFDHSRIAEAITRNRYTITTTNTPFRDVSVVDRNYSLQDYGADAAKTGFLVEAQRCVSLKKGDDIIVIMHARSMRERNHILDQLTTP